MIVTAVRRLLAPLILVGLLPAASAQTLNLRLLQTADVHMQLLDHDYPQDRRSPGFGLSRTVSLIETARREQPNQMLFDNGDLLQGSALGDYLALELPRRPGLVHPAYRVLNALRVDAANIGNHEFDYGLPFLRRALQGARFPVLSANVLDARSGRPAFAPSALLTRRFRDEQGHWQTLRIGVLGLAPARSVAVLREQLQGRIRVRDLVETAQEWVPKLRRQGADLVVVIAHSGIEEAPVAERGADNLGAALSRIPGVDALLLGHAHAEFPGPAFKDIPGVDLERGLLNGVPTVMPGRWGDHLGVLDLRLQRQAGSHWIVRSARAELRPIWDRNTRMPLVEPRAWVEALIRPEHEATRRWVQLPVAQSSQALHSYFAQVRDDASVRLINSAQLERLCDWARGSEWAGLPLLSAAAPFKSGGPFGYDYYLDMPAGTLALRHVVELYPYQNLFKVLRINGAQLREWLEMSAGQFQQIDPKGAPDQQLLNLSYPAYNFDVIAGLDYEIDVTQPARYDLQGQLRPEGGRRIVGLRHGGQTVRDDQVFLVATNNFRARGGGQFPGLAQSEMVLDSAQESRAVLHEYLKTHKKPDLDAQGHWRILPVPGVRLLFRSGAGGSAYLASEPQLREIERAADGSVLYELLP